MKPHLKMNLDVKKITILAFVITIIQTYLFSPPAKALFRIDENISIIVALEEFPSMYQSIELGLEGTGVPMDGIKYPTNVINEMKLKHEKKKNHGLIITKMDYTQEFAQKKFIKAIDKKFAESILRDINPNFNSEDLYYEDDIFALPISRITPMMYYNIDAIREVACHFSNFSEEDVPQDWKSFVKLLEDCQNNSEKMRPLLLGGEIYDWIFHSMVTQHGGSLIDANNNINLVTKQAIEILEMWKDLQDRKLIKIKDHWDTPINVFMNSTTAPIVCFSTDGITKIKEDKTDDFNWTVGPLPVKENGKVTLSGFNIYWGANMTTTQIETSKKVIKKFYQTNVQESIFESGYWPVTKEILDKETATIGNVSTAVSQTAKNQLKHLSNKKGFINHTEVELQVRKAIQDVLAGKTSPKDGLQNAQDALQNK